MRVGLVGTGWWAASTPGPALAASELVELVGVWGRSAEKAATLAAELGTDAIADYDVLLGRADAVAFAVPPDVQQPLAQRAARRGRHLLLEKPFALSTAAADDLLDDIEAAGVAAAVFHTDTFRPETAAALRDLGEQDWSGGRATIFVSVLEPGGVLLDSAWRVERGALWDAGPHAVSPLISVLGPVTEVVALEGSRRTLHAVLRHDETATSTVATTLQAPPAAGAWDVAWWGVKGWAQQPPGTTPSPEAYRNAIVDLHEAVDTGRPTRSPAAHGREVVAVLEAIADAVDGGRTARPRRRGGRRPRP